MESSKQTPVAFNTAPKFSQRFNFFVEKTILFETGGRKDGAYTNDPDDNGKETKWGISKAANPKYDIKKLTKTVAKRIYHYTYYSHYLDKLIDESLAFKVFDMSVLTGKLRAIKTLQKAINKCGIKVKVDGKLGPITVAAANKIYNSLSGNELYNIYIKKYENFFILICLLRPRNRKYKQGWLNRLNQRYVKLTSIIGGNK